MREAMNIKSKTEIPEKKQTKRKVEEREISNNQIKRQQDQYCNKHKQY